MMRWGPHVKMRPRPRSGAGGPEPPPELMAHLHLIATDSVRGVDGVWRPLPEWDGVRLMALFRERLLENLVDKRAISKELVTRLLAWRHPGFSAHVGERIAPEDQQRLEDTVAYLVRNPLSLKKLVYVDSQQAVLYRSNRRR